MAYRETEMMRERKAQARQRIIECAWESVTTGGFRSARITQIASMAGVATGSIYRHFESREELFAEMFRLATQHEVDRVAQALTGPETAAQRLENALRLFAERALRAPTRAWALIAEPVDPKLDEERLVYRRAFARLFEGAIRDGVLDGSLPEQNARLASTSLVGAIAESLIGPLAQASPEPCEAADLKPNELVDAIMQFCMQGLTGTRSQP